MKSEESSVWQIDEESTEDIGAVYQVNLKAFERKEVAEVVDQIRQASPIFYSYVAKVADRIVGHILFTPAHIVHPNNRAIYGLGLAPLAVEPEFQGRGIGSALCREGIRRIDSKKHPFVIVLGHPGYYSRFGFNRASLYEICCAYEDVPEECFMIQMLAPEKMSGMTGVAYYRPEFDSVS